MVSRIVDQVVGMRLEIQLVNSNTWLVYGDDTNSKPVDAFIHMVSEGSKELDALLLRSTCPYLFNIWSQPLFRSSGNASSYEDDQKGSLLLTKLDDMVLGLVLTYLSEEDLAVSVSPVCVRFRTCIVSRNHVDALLGKALATEMSSLFASAQRRSKDSALALADRLGEMSVSMKDAHEAFEQSSHEVLTVPEDQLSKLDRALLKTFLAVPDCSRRLHQLSIGLTAKNALQKAIRTVEKIRCAVRAVSSPDSPAQRCLLHLLGSALAYGNCFGQKQDAIVFQTADEMISTDGDRDRIVDGFTFASLKELAEIKSRFHRSFTAQTAVLLHGQDTHPELSNLIAKGALNELADALFVLCGETTPSVFQLLDGVRSSLNKIKKVSIETTAIAESSPESFHFRLAHLFRLLESQCLDIDKRVALASSEIASLSAWLVPRPHYHRSYEVHGGGGELTSLRDFVMQCRDLLATVSPADLRDLAMTATALEASAIARNASQRALFRQNSAPQRVLSQDFVNATRLISRALDAEEVVRQEREERMTEVMQGVLNEEEQARRKTRLEGILQLRLPTMPSEVEDVTTSTHEEEDDAAEEHPPEVKTLPGTLADQIKAARGAASEEEEEASEQVVAGEDSKEEEEKQPDTVLSAPSPSKREPPPPSVQPGDVNDDFKSLKLWKWTRFKISITNGGIWAEITRSKDVYLRPIDGEEEKNLRKLFSRGLEVAFTVGAKHQKLKHFTSEDFSGLGSKRATMDSSWIVDIARTKMAVQALPQVRAAAARSPTIRSSADQGPSSPPKVASTSVSSPKEDISDAPQLILPLQRILDLKRDGQLSSVNLQPNRLETYLSDEDFIAAFKMSRNDFSKLPGWKRDKLKKDVGVF